MLIIGVDCEHIDAFVEMMNVQFNLSDYFKKTY